MELRCNSYSSRFDEAVIGLNLFMTVLCINAIMIGGGQTSYQSRQFLGSSMSIRTNSSNASSASKVGGNPSLLRDALYQVKPRHRIITESDYKVAESPMKEEWAAYFEREKKLKTRPNTATKPFVPHGPAEVRGRFTGPRSFNPVLVRPTSSGSYIGKRIATMKSLSAFDFSEQRNRPVGREGKKRNELSKSSALSHATSKGRVNTLHTPIQYKPSTLQRPIDPDYFPITLDSYQRNEAQPNERADVTTDEQADEMNDSGLVEFSDEEMSPVKTPVPISRPASSTTYLSNRSSVVTSSSRHIIRLLQNELTQERAKREALELKVNQLFRALG
jgi:hypothetical protein